MAALDIFDSYTIRARLAPALVAMLPLGLGFAAWFPVGDQLKAVPAGAIVALGLATLAAHLGRDLGKAKEPILFAMWDGAPTTTMMTFARTTLNASVIRRLHEHLRAISPEKQLPLTPEEERQDLARARQSYENATAWLREQTRDKQLFPLVAEENANYGFRRNLWAMKPAGSLSAALGAGIAISRIAVSVSGGQAVDPYVALYALIAIGLLVLWVLRISPVWVQRAGIAYAERLLLSAERLATK